MTMIRFENGKEVEFVCPHCGGSEIVELTKEIIECPVAVWDAEGSRPIEYDQDKDGFPLRNTRGTLETEYRCDDCARELDGDFEDDDEGVDCDDDDDESTE